MVTAPDSNSQRRSAGKIGDGRLEQHPGSSLVHVLEPLAKLRVAVEGHGRIDEWSEVDVGLDAARADQGGARFEHRRFAEVPANRRQQGELAQRPMKGSV